ncbi:MAG: LuxR C-terminal-related transcriptional regulator [Actinomycetota bacterium]
MTALRPADLEAVVALVERGAAVADLDAFARFVVREVPALVGCDSISFNEVDVAAGRLVALLEPAELRFPGDVEIWERHRAEHPLLSRYLATGDGRAFRISDVMTQADYRQLALYRELYRRLRTEYQMSFQLPAPPPLVVAVALNRERRDFSERDRAVLNLARPYLAIVRAAAEVRAESDHARDALSRATAAAGREVVILSANGPRFVTDEGRRLFVHYLGGTEDRPVTDGMREWIERQRRADAGFTSPPPTEPLVVGGAGDRLVVRFLPALRPGEDDLLVLERQVPPAVAARLSPREREILGAVADGLTNREAAARLAVSPRTVEKHLEHVYAKLGVQTRAAAIAVALGRIPPPSGEGGT